MRTNSVKIVHTLAVALLFVFLPLFSAHALSENEGLVPCGGPGESECTLNDFIVLGDNVKDALILWIALPISGVLFAYAGFKYLTAMGSEGKIQEAHGIFQNVFFGLILALAGWLIIDFLIGIFVDPQAADNARRFIQ